MKSPHHLRTLWHRLSRPGLVGRLSAGFGCMLLLLCVSVAIGHWRIHTVSAAGVVLLDKRIPRLTLMQDTVAELNALALSARDSLLAPDPADVERHLGDIERGRDSVGERIERLQAALESDDHAPASKALLDEFSQQSSSVLVALTKFSRTVKANRKDSAIDQLKTSLQPRFQALSKSLNAVMAMEMTQLDQAKHEMEQAQRTSAIETLVLVLIGLAFGTFAARHIVRSITGPLGRAAEVADRVSTGDLRQHIVPSGTDQLGQLLSSLQRMQSGLVGTVSEVRKGCLTVFQASTKMAQGSAALSQRNEQQTQSLGVTTSAMEVLSGTVLKNAQSAQRASELATAASQVAQQGSQTMGQAVTTMQGISESSRRITDIINVIDNIAFQTNILALNAAVEAARAGEQGRGFAVVAGEVRNLAQRSATSAREIKALISTSVAQVESGSKLIDHAGQAVQGVVTSILELSHLVSEISQASVKQTAGIETMNRALSVMDGTTRQNAALVDEESAAAQRLKQEAQQLVDAMAAFQLEGQRD